MISGFDAEKAASGKRMLRRPALHVSLILLLTLVSYANTFHAPFILDDVSSIVDNPVIRDLGSFLGGAGFRYHPSYNPRRAVGFLTFALNYHFGGLDPVGYHAVNLVIHAFTALLVYALIRVTFRTPHLRESSLAPQVSLIGLTAALLFAVHPVQTQAVTYTSQRFASLATFFYLLCLVLYAKGRVRQSRLQGPESLVLGPESKASSLKARGGKSRRNGKRNDGGISPIPSPQLATPKPRGDGGSPVPSILFFSAAAGAAILGMMTKEIVATLPLAILLYELCFFRHGRRNRLLFLLPFAAAATMAPLILMGEDGPLGKLFPGLVRHLQESAHIPRMEYFFTQFRVLVTYLRLLVLPIHQNVDYQYPLYTRFLTTSVLLSALFLAALLALALFLYIKGGVPGPESRVPGPKSQVSNSKFKIQNSKSTPRDPSPKPTSRAPLPELRLVAFGIFWFFLTISVTSSVITIADVIFEHRLYLPSVGAFLAFSVLVFMAGRRLPGKVLGAVLLAIVVALSAATFNRNKIWTDPVALWSDVVAKSPAKERGYCNLGYALLEKGRIDEALDKLYYARMLNPEYAKTYLNLGVALARKGRLDEAKENLETALAKNPKIGVAHIGLGVIYATRGQLDQAIEQMEAALRINPADPEARSKLNYYRRLRGR
jgi:hypothetical protein